MEEKTFSRAARRKELRNKNKHVKPQHTDVNVAAVAGSGKNEVIPEKERHKKNVELLAAESDSYRIPGQEVFLVQIVHDKSNIKNKHIAIKLKGVFPSEQAADREFEKMRQYDNNALFDTFKFKMYEWAIVPPLQQQSEGVPIEYGPGEEKCLQDMIDNQLKNQRREYEEVNKRFREMNKIHQKPVKIYNEEGKMVVKSNEEE